MAVGIIVKNYEHFNKALPNWTSPKGVYVKSKDHYDRLVKEAGMVSSDKGHSNPNIKEYKLSSEGQAIIEAAKNSKKRDGSVVLSDRTIDAMRAKGIIGKKIPSYMQLPKQYENKGGFQD